MESDLSKRIKVFIRTKNISIRKFEGLANLSNGFVNNITNGIGAEKMQSIIYAFPELNANWLLTGKGDMLREPNDSNSNSIVIGNNDMKNGSSILNNSSITGGDAGLRAKVKHMEEILIEKEKIIAEKERMIQLLLRDR